MSKAEFNKSMLVMQGVRPEIAEHIVGQVEALKTENDQIRACLGAALQDADRLDWLEAHPLQSEIKGGSDDGHTGTFWGLGAANGTLREAIDTIRNRTT